MNITGMQGMICISVIYFLVLFILRKHLKSNVFVKFFAFLFVLFIFGSIRMKTFDDRLTQYDVYDDGDSISVHGEIIDIYEKQYGYALCVRDNDIYHYVYINSLEGIAIGYVVSIEGEFVAMKKPRNPGNFNQKKYYLSQAIASVVQCEDIRVITEQKNNIAETIRYIRETLKVNIEKLVDEKEAGILKAMLLGDKADMDKDISLLYQEAGIAHLLCISGLHISVWGNSIFKLFRRKFSYYASSVISVLFMILFGILAGNGVSTTRALIMFVISLVSKVLGRRYDLQTSVMLTVGIMLYVNPFYIQNVSFLLSVLAIVAIGFVYPVLWEFISRRLRFSDLKRSDKNWKIRFKEKLLQSVVVSASINIVTAPVIASVYYEISLYSVFINLLVVPLMTLLLWMGVFAILIGYIWLDAGRFFIGTSVYILKIYEKVCEINEELPYHTLYVKEPEKVTVCCYYILLVGMILLFMKLGYKYVNTKCSRRYMEISGILISVIMMIFIVRRDTETLATFVDVGQGDCAFINIEGCRILVDGGSSDVKNVGEYRIAPCIRSMGYIKVDVVIVSHIDNDHISGIKEIIEKDLLEIGVVILSTGTNNEFIEFLDSHNIQYKFVESGDSIKFSEVSIDIVHPKEEYQGNTNQRSLVCYLRSEDIDILFTGDISSEEEKIVVGMMMNRYGVDGLDVDILKVAHHGSKYSTSSEFLEKLGARKAIISCGMDNSYGHPHKETLSRLEDVGCNMFITSKSGAVRIYKGNHIEIYVDN